MGGANEGVSDGRFAAGDELRFVKFLGGEGQDGGMGAKVLDELDYAEKK
jgi:hypothetical protein